MGKSKTDVEQTLIRHVEAAVQILGDDYGWSKEEILTEIDKAYDRFFADG